MLGVSYSTPRWSWNLNPEKVKGVLHNLYDMAVSVSVINELAMRVGGKVAHYGPLFAGTRWWCKPFTNLPDHDASKRKLISLTYKVILALGW